MSRHQESSFSKQLQAVSCIVVFGLSLLGCGGGGAAGGSDSTNGGVPIASVGTAVNTSQTGAMLLGHVVPNGLPTDVWFEYGTSPALAAYDNTARESLPAGTDNVLVDAAISGLSPSTTYYFRVCSSNSKGEDKSSITNFTTSSLGPDYPVTVTVAASSVGATTATLNGNVTPNGLATDAWFEYGTSSTLSGATGTTHESIGDGTVSVAVDAALTGLTPGTTYYYRIVAGNSSGATSGTIMSFTPGGAPAVANLAATSVGATTATLNGSVTPNGLATQAWFEYGTSSNLSGATSTTHESIGAGSETVAVDAALTGLTTGTTYYYRVVASNSTGTASGSPILSFTVGAAPTVATLTASSVGATGAVLNSHVFTNGLATEAWFEWGTSPTLAGATSEVPASIGSGSARVAVNKTLTGLTTGTTYYYRVVASNSTGTSNGDIMHFTAAASEWSLAGSMGDGAGRAWHTATLLGDGKVLIAAGYDIWEHSLATAMVYDPDTGTFASTTGPMSTARRFHTATLLANDQVLMTGGRNDNNGVFSSAELYDPAAGTFSDTGSMSTTRWLHTATRLADGKVLITGGIGPGWITLATAELYDPDAGTFSAVGSMGTGRYHHTATLLADGKVLLTGGVGSGGAVLATAELYDPDTQTFAATGSMATARQQQTATRLADGKVLIIGGASGVPGGVETALSSVERYDPGTGTFSAVGSMASARYEHSATLLSSGKVLVAGGRTGSAATSLPTAELYDPDAEAFAADPGSMVESRRVHTSTLLSGGNVLTVGGKNQNNTSRPTAELYVPAE